MKNHAIIDLQTQRKEVLGKKKEIKIELERNWRQKRQRGADKIEIER